MLSVPLPRSSSQPFYDSGANELHCWRVAQMYAAYENAGSLLFMVALQTTKKRAMAEDTLVRTFVDLGQETSVLASGMATRRAWLLRRVMRYSQAAILHLTRLPVFDSKPFQPAVSDQALGRALYTILSQTVPIPVAQVDKHIAPVV